jgi:hypothetical protein
MMPLRLSRGVVITTALAALLAVPSAASAGAGFVRDLSIDPVTVACPKAGPEKGRVVVDVPVHYSDVTKDREDSVRGKKQRLYVIVQVLSPDNGKVLVTVKHSDKGKLAVSRDRVDHVHRIVLTAKDSADRAALCPRRRRAYAGAERRSSHTTADALQRRRSRAPMRTRTRRTFAAAGQRTSVKVTLLHGPCTAMTGTESRSTRPPSPERRTVTTLRSRLLVR